MSTCAHSCTCARALPRVQSNNTTPPPHPLPPSPPHQLQRCLLDEELASFNVAMGIHTTPTAPTVPATSTGTVLRQRQRHPLIQMHSESILSCALCHLVEFGLAPLSQIFAQSGAHARARLARATVEQQQLVAACRARGIDPGPLPPLSVPP